MICKTCSAKQTANRDTGELWGRILDRRRDCGAAAEIRGTRARLARLLSETGADLAAVGGALRVARRVAGDLDLGETLALAERTVAQTLDRLSRERQRIDFEAGGER